MNINEDIIKNVINVDTSINNNSLINILKGKNLFDKTTLVQRDMTDIVSENKRTTSRQIIYLKAGTYTFSTNLNTSIYSYIVSTCASNPMPNNNYNSIYSSGYITNSSITFTLTAQQEGYFMLMIRKIDNSAYTLSDVSGFNYYLAKGSSATTESYITPTINVDGENIYVKGQNEVYSNAEQRIGTWINNKPIYRQVIQGTTASSNSPTAIGSISNLGTIVNIRGYIISASQSIPINFVYNTEQNAGYKEGNNIIIRATASSYQNKPCYVIVEYTKTTD